LPLFRPSFYPLFGLSLFVLGCAATVPSRPAALGSSAAVASAETVASREQTADQQVHHVLNRLAFGARPGDVEAVRAMGVDAWIELQLAPERMPDVAAEQFVARFTSLGQTGEQLLVDHPPPAAAAAQLQRRGGTMSAADSAAVREQGRQSYAFVGELASSRVARAVISERQLNEVMVDFWENHFNVFAGKDRTRYFLPEYDSKTIRPHALGSFRELLGAVAKSPAMLYYLDNWQSVADSGRPTLRPAPRPLNARQAARRAAAVQQRMARNPARPQAAQQAAQPAAQRRRGLNENFARELLELHTLGVDGGYTQQDVIEVARAFTGWTIARGAQGGGFAFRGEVHDASAKTILGTSFGANQGVQEGEAVLDLLASHPSTAIFIATKLARRFVSDTPPAALVERASATFRRTRGDIRAVVRTIVTSPEFFASASYRAKVKSPFELVTSTMRAMNAPPDATPRTSQLVSRLGQPIFGHQAPNGYPETGDAWMNTGAILNRINFGLAAASGRVPGIALSAWPLTAELSKRSRDAQVDGVITELFGGAVSADTRQVLLTGTNPFLQQHGGANDSLLVADDEATMMSGMASSEMTANTRKQAASARRAARAPVAQQQQAAGREAVKPARGATLTQSIGSLPSLTGFAQIVGLALGAPEFQRR